jgi:hypothetical protein
MPVILATQEAELRRTAVQSQPREIVCKTLSQKYPTKRGLVESLPSKHETLSSKPQYHKKKKKGRKKNESIILSPY